MKKEAIKELAKMHQARENHKAKIRVLIKVIEKSGSSVWDFTTLNYCQPNRLKLVKKLFLEIGIHLNKNHLISVPNLKEHLAELSNYYPTNK